MRQKKLAQVLAAVGVVAIVAAACSSDDDDSGSADEGTTASTEQVVSGSEAEDTTTESDDAAAEEGSTIVDLAVATPELSTLVEAVQAAGLVETLSSEGPFTVFAPTNDAFAAIPQETLDQILADKELLTSILTYHVVEGSFPAADVAALPDVATGAEVPTVQGGSVTIVADGGSVMVNDATVVMPDVMASNGVVHVIDTVLLPPGLAL